MVTDNANAKFLCSYIFPYSVNTDLPRSRCFEVSVRHTGFILKSTQVTCKNIFELGPGSLFQDAVCGIRYFGI